MSAAARPFSGGPWLDPVVEAGEELQIAISSNDRYFVDGDENPVFLNGFAAWSMPAQLNQAETEEFLDHCVAHGINLLWFSTPEAYFSDQTEHTGTDTFGNSPWTGAKWTSSFRTAHWDHVSWVLEQCEERGIYVLIFPCYLGNGGGAEGWWQDSAEAAGEAGMTTYGANFGTFLNPHPNVLIAIGGDYWYGSDDTPSAAAAQAIKEALVAGIKSTDRAGRLYTTHWSSGAASIAFGEESWLDFNSQYDVFSSYVTTEQTRDGWDETPTRPTGIAEGFYWGNGDTAELELRLQYSYAFAWGACWVTSSDEGVWNFDAPTSYRTDLEYQTQMDRAYWDHFLVFRNILSGRNWHLAEPDHGHTFITTGYGTENTAGFIACRAYNKLLFAYAGSGGTARIDKSKFDGNIDILRIDPTSGAVTALQTNVANSGTYDADLTPSNAADDDDWWLVVRRNGAT